MLALLFSLVAVAQPARPGSPIRDDEDIAALEMLLMGDPVKVAANAIKRGDLRLLGIAGYSVSIPGVADNIAHCEPVFKNVVIVKGTSDVVWGDNAALIESAQKYATR